MSEPTLTPEAAEAIRIIDALGGTAAVAKIFDIKSPSVSEWRSVGIPKARLQYLRLAHPGVFEADVQAKAA